MNANIKKLVLILLIIAVASCGTTYIRIQQPDKVWEYGELKYTVETGDVLQILSSKTCRNGSGICWKVKNVKTGEIGYVVADRMKDYHEVYTGEK